jgi:flagellar hook-basal body complex protein FliE
MLTLKPELQQPVHIPMKTTDPRHISSGDTVGFSGSFTHGGALTNFDGKVFDDADAGARINFGELITQSGKTRLPGQGSEMAALGRITGASAVLRDGVYGLSNSSGVSFSEEMLKAIDRVSGFQNTADAIAQEALTNPGSVDAHDLTIAQAEAAMSLNIAHTILNRLTQAWRDIINTR